MPPFSLRHAYRVVNLVFDVGKSPNLVQWKDLAAPPSVMIIILRCEKAGFCIGQIKSLVPR